ncbi:MAG: cell division protein FtsQ/DivIB [Lachnospiraceae bacterium]
MRRRSKILIAIIVVVIILTGLIVAAGYFFRVDMENGITYVGNKQHTEEELTSMIFGDSVNTLSYSLFESKKQVKIPFVQRYAVEIDWPDKLTVIIYEKPIIGYIKYMGSNMYFDKEGVVVESSSAIIADVPQITGINFNSIVLGEKLVTDKPEVYSRIVELLQDFDKNNLQVDRIHFDSSLDATLYFGKVKVMIGGNDNLSEKIHELAQVYPSLIGLEGTLHMEEFEPDNPKIFFNKE